MSTQKKLRSVPSAPVEIRRPSDCPKPATADVLTGTKPDPAVSHALRGVIRDHSYIKPRERGADHPSRLTMFLWTVVIAALIVAGYMATLKKAQPQQVITYPLQRN